MSAKSDKDLSWLLNHLAQIEAMKKSVFEADATHSHLERSLGNDWNEAIAMFGGKKEAAEFLLLPNAGLGNKPPADVICFSEDGLYRYKKLLESMHLSFQ